MLDALGIGRAALVGNSRGGVIAFDTAIEYPDRVVAVVGVGGRARRLRRRCDARGDRAFDEMDRLEVARAARSPTAVADIDVRVWVDGPGQPPTRVLGLDPRRGPGDGTRRSSPRATSTGQPIPLEPRAAERLGELRVPVLAVAGRARRLRDRRDGRHLEANAPDARAIVWDDVAHMIGMEVPERLAGAIVEFLAPLPRWD